MNEDLKEKINELLNRATVSLAVNYDCSFDEIKLRRREFRGLTNFWSCCYDADKEQWVTFNLAAESTIKYYDSEREALIAIINIIESDKKYFYTKERFVEEIEEAVSKLKIKVGIFMNKPYSGPYEEYYFVEGYYQVGNIWRNYFSKYIDYNRKSEPIILEYKREEDILYFLLNQKSFGRLSMTKDEMKEQIVDVVGKLDGMKVYFEDKRKEANVFGCCFDKKLGKYVFYANDELGQEYYGSKSIHEEFCIAELYEYLLMELKLREMLKK